MSHALVHVLLEKIVNIPILNCSSLQKLQLRCFSLSSRAFGLADGGAMYSHPVNACVGGAIV